MVACPSSDRWKRILTGIGAVAAAAALVATAATAAQPPARDLAPHALPVGMTPGPGTAATATSAVEDLSAPAAALHGGPATPESTVPPLRQRALLLDPDDPEWDRAAPDLFRARFATSKGDFVVQVHRDWAPRGADRFYNLVRMGFYDDTRVFRIRAGVFAQFGLSGDPGINAVWYGRTIPDDPPSQRHTRGRVFFAMRGLDDRTTQAVIDLRDNPDYFEQGFVPFGEVIEGMEVADGLYSGYGERAGGGMRAGNQGRIVAEGNAHLDADFPLLDRIYRAVIEPPRDGETARPVRSPQVSRRQKLLQPQLQVRFRTTGRSALNTCRPSATPLETATGLAFPGATTCYYLLLTGDGIRPEPPFPG